MSGRTSRVIEAGAATCDGRDMNRKMIPIEEAFAAWRKDPKYVAAYDALEDKFSSPAGTFNMGELPSVERTGFLLYAARSAHQFCAVRIRQKLAYGTNTETLLAEADEMVRRDVGDYPSEDTYDADPDSEEAEALEQAMREIFVSNYEALSETESYMWGLGIAGLFHQWERDTRGVIAVLQDNAPNSEKLNSMSFKELCIEVGKTGFAITGHPSFAQLRTGWLITNTIKHGRGGSFSQLVAEKPEMFQGGPVGVRMGNLTPQPEHLRLWEKHFDDAASAIDRIWFDYERVIILSAQQNKEGNRGSES